MVEHRDRLRPSVVHATVVLCESDHALPASVGDGDGQHHEDRTDGQRGLEQHKKHEEAYQRVTSAPRDTESLRARTGANRSFVMERTEARGGGSRTAARLRRQSRRCRAV